MTYEKHYLLHDPERCSKFESCNATLCPLDSQRATRVMHRDDPACFYLLEVGKSGSQERISMWHSVAMYQVASEVFQELMSMACPIKKSLIRVANTPSRIRTVGKVAQQLGVM